MTRLSLMLVLMCAACGGAEQDAPIDNSMPDGDAAPAATKPTIALCDGSPPEAPALCQQLRYGDHGYCNFWHECG